jgi:cell division protein FtsB
MTGDEVTTNMLSKRYKRLKANLADVEPKHHDIFYEALDQVNDAIEKEIKDLHNKKWNRVAEAMEEKAAMKYEVSSSSALRPNYELTFRSQ